MAYDSDRDVFVLFGGLDAPTYFNDTWEYDGTNWKRIITATSPSVRATGGMVYDSDRKVVILFSGLDGSVQFDETWEYDGTDWTQATPAGSPGSRNGPGMIYDPVRKVTVLFGGQGLVAAFNDTWEYDGTTWTQVITTTSPSARGVNEAGMVFDSDRNKVVLFGGIDGFGFIVYGDTWEYDGTDWTQITPSTSPPATGLHAMEYDPDIKKTVMFGGFDATGILTFDDTWMYDGTDWVKYTTGKTTPLPRIAMRLVFDSTRRRLFMFGGDSEINGATFVYVLQRDTWEFDASTPDPWKQLSLRFADRAIDVNVGARISSGALGWTTLTPIRIPPVRTRAQSVYDPVRKRIVMFGGLGATLRLNDTWQWDGYDWELMTPATSPTIREGHAMIFDTLRSRIVMFGGLDTGGALAETWVYDGTTWSQLSPATSPPGREDPAMGYDIDRDRIILFGGFASGSPLADTWEFDGTTWAQVFPVTNPSARAFTMSAYDAFRKRLVIFGGQDNVPNDLAETWEFDGNDWAQISPTTSPVARFRGKGVYSPTDRRFIIFGGVEKTLSTNYDDTWEWDGQNWTDTTIATVKPSARDGSSLAYDGSREALILHGGGVLGGAGSLSDTLWHPAAQNPKVLGPECVATGPLETFVATVTATDPDKVNFTIVVNSTQRWYDGTSWTKSDGSFSNSNSAADINTNAASLDLEVGDLFQVCAILHSDNGITAPEVDDVTVTFSTPPGAPPPGVVANTSENPPSNQVINMSVATVLTAGVVTKILVTLKSVSVLAPSSTQFITDNDLIPEILVKAGLPKDEAFTTLNEVTSGTQGDLFVVEVELTP